MTHPQQHWLPPAPRQASTRGAKILTFSGIGVFILGLIGIGFSIFVIASIVPTAILTATGGPGSEVITTSDVPGQTTVQGTAGSSYTVWTVSKTTTPAQTERPNVEIDDADGNSINLRGPSVTGATTHQTYAAKSLATFTTPTSGAYTLTVTRSPDNDNDEWIFVSPAQDFGSFFTGIFSSVGLMILGTGGLVVGIGLGLGGGVWWAITVSNNKKPRGIPQHYPQLPGRQY